LAFGALSTREVVQALDRRRRQLSPVDKGKFERNLIAFGSRLAWRCHFIQKLEDQPSIETNCMHPAFEGLREKEHREDYFEAWKTGKTGIPFVDACMRNLISTGWITFRMRAMLVSFASYQLWLDWRKTAPYLAGLFTDYEPGIHYSQFQMQSGVTGINAIRVYNPIKQGLDQDPKGIFVRKWVPEIRHIKGEAIHQPWLQEQTLFRATSDQDAVTYPAPIVDLTLSAKAAKDKLAAVRKSDAFFINKNAVYIRHGSRKRTAKSKSQNPAPDQLNLF
jgi:deoxyribodipyrimidine photo-lyase